MSWLDFGTTKKTLVTTIIEHKHNKYPSRQQIPSKQSLEKHVRFGRRTFDQQKFIRRVCKSNNGGGLNNGERKYWRSTVKDFSVNEYLTLNAYLFISVAKLIELYANNILLRQVK